MSDIQIGLLSILGILLLIQSGMHVSVALLLLSFCGVWAMKDNGIIAGKMLSLAAAERWPTRRRRPSGSDAD